MVLHSLRIFRNLFTPHSSPVPLLPHCMQGQEDGIQALAELHNQYHCFGRRLKELNPKSHLERQGFDLETLAPIDKGEMKKRQELAYEELEGEELCGMRLRILHWQNYVIQWPTPTLLKIHSTLSPTLVCTGGSAASPRCGTKVHTRNSVSWWKYTGNTATSE